MEIFMKMLKRIVSFICIAVLSAAVLPPAYAKGESVILSESFENFADNGTEISAAVKMTAGVDRRVIREEGGSNKALYSKAWGCSAKAVATIDFPDDAIETTYSAKIKVSGNRGGGQFFTLSDTNRSVTILKLDTAGVLRLSNGKKVADLPYGKWNEYTVTVDWRKQIFSVYINEKKVVVASYLPSENYLPIREISWLVNEPDEGFAEFYIDDVRVYIGSSLPSAMSFPAKPYSNEVKEFVPTDMTDTELVIYKQIDFNDGKTAALKTVQKGAATVEAGTLCDSGAIHMSVNKQTGTYFDIEVPEVADVDKYVVSMDLCINEMSGDATIAFMDGKDTRWRLGGRIDPGGAISMSSGVGRYNAAGASITLKKRTEIAVVFDYSRDMLSLYIDGEFVSSVDSSAFKARPTLFRMIDVTISSSGKVDLLFDNMRVYKAREPLPRESFEEDGKKEDDNPLPGGSTSIVNKDSEAITAISSASVLMLTNDSMFTGGKKQKYPDGLKPSLEGGTLMLPTELCGLIYPDVKIEKKNGMVTIADKLTFAAATETAGGNVPFEKNGTLYLPCRELAEGLGKSVYYDDRGFVVLSDSEFAYKNSPYILKNTEPIDNIYHYMQFDNPTGEEMAAALRANCPNNMHPRIYMRMQDIDYVLDKKDTTDEWKNAYKAFGVKANLYTGDFTISNTPNDTDATSFCEAESTLGPMYLMTGDKKYADAGVELMMTAASWDSLAPSTSQLIGGLWAEGMAYGIDYFYNYMKSTADGREKLAYLKQRIHTLAFEPLCDALSNGSNILYWPTLDDNFVGVIGGGMLKLAMTVADEPELEEECEYLMENVYKPLRLLMDMFTPDGAWYEGVSYGDYALRQFAPTVYAMEQCFGDDYGLLDVKGAEKMQDWYTYTGTPQGSLNFHDMYDVTGSGYYSFGGFIVAYLKNNVEAMAAAKRWLSTIGKSMELPYLMLYERATQDRGIDVKAPNDLDHYFRVAEAGTFYSSLESRTAAFVGFHGGETGMSHDQLDLGEFVFHNDGVAWAFDLGSDNYDLPQYFNIPVGYRYYRKNAQGENVLLINPMKDADYYGQKVGAKVELVDYETAPRAAKAAYDLTDAYERDVSSYIRGYYFGDNRNTLTIRDEVVLKEQSDVYWQMHTKADIEIKDKHTVILKKDGKLCEASIYCSAADYSVENMKCELLPGSPGLEYSDAARSNDGARKLAVHIPDASAGKLTIVVKLSPVRDNYSKSPIDTNTKIADWVLPDGEMPKPLCVNAIYFDGKAIENFYPEIYEYTVNLPFGQETLPEISVDKDADVSVDIYYPEDKAQTVITVMKDGYADEKYLIKYAINSDRSIKVTENVRDVVPVVGVPGKMILPKFASASDIPEPQNGPGNMIDDDLNTRCSGVEGCWREIDLGRVYDFSGVAIALLDGTKRKVKYDLLYSEDGINYERVFSGEATGETDGFESVAIPGRARYIRFAGYGNNISRWNTITEFRVYE